MYIRVYTFKGLRSGKNNRWKRSHWCIKYKKRNGVRSCVKQLFYSNKFQPNHRIIHVCIEIVVTRLFSNNWNKFANYFASFFYSMTNGMELIHVTIRKINKVDFYPEYIFHIFFLFFFFMSIYSNSRYIKFILQYFFKWIIWIIKFFFYKFKLIIVYYVFDIQV